MKSWSNSTRVSAIPDSRRPDIRIGRALQEVAGDDIFWKRLLSRKLELRLSYHEDWEGKIHKLDFKKLADGLKPLLTEAGETGDPDGMKGYDATYRVQSLFAVHAGLSTIGSYLRYGERVWGVVPRPAAPFPRVSQTPALHTVHLAQYVFKAFGLPVEELDDIGSRLLEASRQPGCQVPDMNSENRIVDRKPTHPWRVATNDRYREVVRMLIGLSTASLLLPVFLAREFLGISQETPLRTVIAPTAYWSWGSLVIAVFSGVMFHYLSAKWVRLAWGQDASILFFKLSDTAAEKALEWSFWVTVAGFFAGIGLTVCFFLEYAPAS